MIDKLLLLLLMLIHFLTPSAATVYSGPNFLVGIVGLDKLSTIGVGLVAAFVVIAITYAQHLLWSSD